MDKIEHTLDYSNEEAIKRLNEMIKELENKKNLTALSNQGGIFIPFLTVQNSK